MNKEVNAGMGAILFDPGLDGFEQDFNCSNFKCLKGRAQPQITGERKARHESARIGQIQVR
jgi:hypothetical protein